MMSILGESGLSVFQAGHWLWQRPHSVQVVKSSRPFQVKSSTLPTPSAASSSSSSMFSKSSGSPSTMSGWSSPRQVRPSACRLKKMLKNARNRCQATPIVGWSEMVIIQANEMRILTAAMTTMRFLTASIARPVNALPIQPVSGKCSAVSWPVPGLRGQGPLQGAQQADADGDAEDGELDVVGLPEVEPKKRERRPPSPAALRGWFFWRIAMSSDDATKPAEGEERR